MKTFLAFLLIIMTSSVVAPSAYAKGGGGGHASGGRSSFGGSRTTNARTVAARPKTAAQAKAEKVQQAKVAAATAKQKAQETKYQKAADKQPIKKTVNGKSYAKGETVGVNGYSPRFAGGYTAPPGSVVYYQQSSSAWNWLPWYYIMTHDGNQQAVVQQPNGKQQAVQEEGGDGMYVFNWILVIILSLGLIALVIYFVNKATRKEVNYATY